MVTVYVVRHCGDTLAKHHVGIHVVVHVAILVLVNAQDAKPCLQAHQQDDMLDDDDEDDGPEEEEEASEPETRVARRKRVLVPRPSAGTPVKPESLEEVEQRLQPGSVKHAIFQVHDSPACASLKPFTFHTFWGAILGSQEGARLPYCVSRPHCQPVRLFDLPCMLVPNPVTPLGQLY